MCMGLVVTTDGLTLGYEVFAGNVHDLKTVRKIVRSMEAKYGKTDWVWVMDRGMVSEEILSWMRRKGRRYVVGCPKSELRKHKEKLMEEEGWKTIG